MVRFPPRKRSKVTGVVHPWLGACTVETSIMQKEQIFCLPGILSPTLTSSYSVTSVAVLIILLVPKLLDGFDCAKNALVYPNTV